MEQRNYAKIVQKSNQLYVVSMRDSKELRFSVTLDNACSVARYMGWKPCDKSEDCNDYTDGSVPCEHYTPEQMEASAYSHIGNCVGLVFDEPGWWMQ